MRKYIIISLSIWFVIFINHDIKAQCISQSELDVLVAIYNATGGANWTNNTGFDIFVFTQ